MAEYRSYQFSSINPNTKKKTFFMVKAKSYYGAVAKARLQTRGHTRLKLDEEGLSKPPRKEGKKVDALADKLKF